MTDYSILETKIFNGVKSYFQKLPPLDSDDYDNGFFDLVAQYGAGGEDYVGIQGMYEDVIESTILDLYNKLTGTDKKELQVFYERNFLDNYFDSEIGDFIYSPEELASIIFGRLKCWIDDNYSLDELLEGYDDEEE